MPIASTICALMTVAGAQVLLSQPPADHEHAGHRSPYAQQGETGIAALSPRELEQLEAGEGMGLARAAELNRYPGPKHVLELADELDLSGEQEEGVRRIFEAMQDAARDLGARIIEAERRLDLHFRHRHIEEETLRPLTTGLAQLYGDLRFAHLRAHLTTTALLSREQIEEYNRLRGYGASH